MDTLKKLKDLNGLSTEHSLIVLADKINASRVTSGMGFEKVFRNACKKAGISYVRSDYKNNVPDFLASNRYGEYVYLECKYYGAQKHKSWTNVVALYMKKQRKQYEAFLKLANRAPIYFLTVAKESTEEKPKVKLIRLTKDSMWVERHPSDI